MGKSELLMNDNTCCPLCGSVAFKVKRRIATVECRQCKKCALIFSAPLLKGGDEDVGEADSTVTAVDYMRDMNEQASMRGELSIGLARRRFEEYEKILGKAPGKVLEVGAGDGAYHVGYSALGVDYTGIDINKAIVDRANSLGRNVILGSPETLLGRERFDVIFFSQVLEHVLNPNDFLQCIHRLLSPDGIIHIDVPNQNGFWSLVRRARNLDSQYGFIQLPYHQIAYTKRPLAYALRTTGFKPLWIGQKSSYDKVWGKIIVDRNTKGKVALDTPTLIGLGSLLVAVAENT